MARTKQTVRRTPLSATILKRSLPSYKTKNLNDYTKIGLDECLTAACVKIKFLDETVQNQSFSLNRASETITNQKKLIDAQTKEIEILKKTISSMKRAVKID